MTLVTIDGMTFVAPWQQGMGSTLEFLMPNGRRRVIQTIGSQPPDNRWFVCEWSPTAQRYEAPVEAPPTGMQVAGIPGSTRGDTGWVPLGSKHGGEQLRIREFDDGRRVAQLLITSRPPNGTSGTPFMLAAGFTLPIAVAPSADYLVRQLQKQVTALQNENAALARRVAALEGV